MNNINHHAVLPLVQEADRIVQAFYEAEGELLSSAGILLGAVQTVKENADEWVSNLELAITPRGYELNYEPAESVIGMDLDSIVLDLMVRGLEVQEESLWG